MKMIIPSFEDFAKRKYYEAMYERDSYGEEQTSVEKWLDENQEYLREEYLLIANMKKENKSDALLLRMVKKRKEGVFGVLRVKEIIF